MCNCCNLSREHSLWTVCFHIPDLQTVCGRSRILQLWIHLFRLTGAGGAKEKRPVVRSNHRPFVTCRPHALGGKATKLTEALSWCLVKSLSVKAGEAGRTRLWMCRHSSASQKLRALPLDPSVEPPAGGVAMCWPHLWRREEASDEVPAGLTEAAKLWLHKRSHAAAWSARCCSSYHICVVY